MRIIVTGGRNYSDSAQVFSALMDYETTRPTIVHGGASGADALAEEAARTLGFPVEVWPADWRSEGKGAGPRRNQRMVDAGADLCLAFAGGRGTSDCVKRAVHARIPVARYT